MDLPSDLLFNSGIKYKQFNEVTNNSIKSLTIQGIYYRKGQGALEDHLQ